MNKLSKVEIKLIILECANGACQDKISVYIYFVSNAL